VLPSPFKQRCNEDTRLVLMKVIGNFNTISLFVGSALIVGCAREPIKPGSVAYSQKLADGAYEIELPYTERTWGGPCNFTFTSTTGHASDWLYVRSTEGELNADQITATAYRGERGYPSAMQGLRGMVSFSKDQMTVQLEQPAYPDGVHMQGYVPYFLNGTYQIIKK
jgi:hypothetical protein